MNKLTENDLIPIHAFRFQVTFTEQLLGSNEPGSEVPLCSGSFAECSGLEATMAPKVIVEGGRNWGPAQRMGPVTFATVILKRGFTRTGDLWTWFDLIGQGAYAYRLNTVITVFNQAGDGMLSWTLKHALPTKFKAADLTANVTDIAIEELHLAHEGLTREAPVSTKLGASA